MNSWEPSPTPVLIPYNVPLYTLRQVWQESRHAAHMAVYGSLAGGKFSIEMAITSLQPFREALWSPFEGTSSSDPPRDTPYRTALGIFSQYIRENAKDNPGLILELEVRMVDLL